MMLFKRIKSYFIYRLIHSFNKLGACCMPGTFLDTGFVSVNKKIYSLPSESAQNCEARQIANKEIMRCELL